MELGDFRSIALLLVGALLGCSPGEGQRGGPPESGGSPGTGGAVGSAGGAMGGASGGGGSGGVLTPRADAGEDAAVSDDGSAGNQSDSAEARADADTGSEPDGQSAALTLSSTGFLTIGSDLVFPASASYPKDESPPFSWKGAPATTKSFALTFVDDDNGATKWIVWDIPPSVMALPGKLSKTVHPAEVPQATQRGSLGRTGYSGPGVPGPPLHTYEFIIWALDVDALPATDGKTTAQIRADILPMHRIAASSPLVAKGQEGGP